MDQGHGHLSSGNNQEGRDNCPLPLRLGLAEWRERPERAAVDKERLRERGVQGLARAGVCTLVLVGTPPGKTGPWCALWTMCKRG